MDFKRLGKVYVLSMFKLVWMLSIVSICCTVVDRSRKGLKTFPMNVLVIENVVELNLSDNHLTSLPKEIEKFN